MKKTTKTQRPTDEETVLGRAREYARIARAYDRAHKKLPAAPGNATEALLSQLHKAHMRLLRAARRISAKRNPEAEEASQAQINYTLNGK
jgi:hypothetical protein